jgi:hypothetical protein
MPTLPPNSHQTFELQQPDNEPLETNINALEPLLPFWLQDSSTLGSSDKSKRIEE